MSLGPTVGRPLSPQNKKASSTGGLKRLLKLVRAVAGQAKADAPSEGAQYHHVNGDTAAEKTGVTADTGAKGTRPTMGRPDIIRGGE